MNQNTYNVIHALLYISHRQTKIHPDKKITSTMTKARILKSKIIPSQLFILF